MFAKLPKRMQPSIPSHPSDGAGRGWLHAIIILSLCLAGLTAPANAADVPTRYDQLVVRLRGLETRAGDFGPTYEPLYRAALAWYETWGNHTNDPADTYFVAPDDYAAEFADALEHGHNFIGEHLGSAFPMAFEKKLPDGTVVKANYQLTFPAGFPEKGRKFPLIIGLHGSGWLGHKISYVRGGQTGGRVFQVTPIDQSGPWKLNFLNAYLDELLRILPVDPDKVYVEGHSLGAMATWDWAMNNPERFAAISPRDGSGAAFRAVRLKHVPVWVVHGGADDTILPAYADQMVTALQAVGGTVKYSLLKGAPHNLPPDFDQHAVVDWYLQQTRSHKKAPADPLDSLGIDASGFSKTAIVKLPAGWFWKSASMPTQFGRGGRSVHNNSEKLLFKKVEDLGALVDSPIRQELDPQKQLTALWLAIPNSIQSQVKDDDSVTKLADRKAARFYCRGDARTALARAISVSTKLKGEGKTPADTVWLTTLTPEQRGTNQISECWIELK
jgi:predicted esterase